MVEGPYTVYPGGVKASVWWPGSSHLPILATLQLCSRSVFQGPRDWRLVDLALSCDWLAEESGATVPLNERDAKKNMAKQLDRFLDSMGMQEIGPNMKWVSRTC